MKGIEKRLAALLCVAAMLMTTAFAAGPGADPQAGAENGTEITDGSPSADPAGTDTPTDTDALADTDTPTGTDVPADTDTPTVTDAPAGTDTPTGTDTTTGTDTPTGTDAPTDTDTPADTDVPNEPTDPTESEDQVQLFSVTAGDRDVTLWNDDWEYSEDANEQTGAGGTWKAVTLPHTWNAEDGADGGNNYRRATSWYKKTLPWNADYANKEIYLEFLGSSLVTDVFVNGKPAGASHRGGYTAFRYNLTDLLEAGQKNEITVRVNNERQVDLLPLGGDFTIFGGIYRNVNLIVADMNAHLALDDSGSSGVYLTPTVKGTTGNLKIRAKVTGDAEGISVTATIKEPDGFTGIPAIADPIFTPGNMGDDSVKGAATLTKDASDEWTGDIDISNVHLWNGVEDPFRYEVKVEVKIDGTTVDSVTQMIGFRSFKVTDEGFFLNGELYPLRGVSRHQDGYDETGETYLGNALSPAEHERDLGMIYEMGANYVRLAHYPHDPYFYELCDRYGLVVWAEIPMVGGVPTAKELEQYGEGFKANAKSQLVEMIRQHYNHPSICFWGVTNEINEVKGTTFVKDLIAEQNITAHNEDPTRLTTYAAERNGDGTWDTDLISWNIYPNWYYEDTLTNMMEVRKGATSGNKPVGISEYGAGANIEQHDSSPVFSIGQSRGQWHPEEYQGIWHEGVLKEINAMPTLWGTAVWNMFDFGSDNRDEGGKKGVNDKGLVTMDREVKKDAFYLYKANWNDRDKFAHINSSRFNPREESEITVRVYSNYDKLTLTVNDQDYGVKNNNGVGVFEWENVPLVLGENTAAVKTENGTVLDTVKWTRQKGSTAQLANAAPDKMEVDNTNAVITLRDTITVGEFNDAISGMNGTTLTLLDAQGAEVTDRTLTVNTTMTVRAVSEDESDIKTYTFAEPNLAAGKEVTAATQLGMFPATNAVDLNSGTYWSSDRGTRSSITVDLGADYNLNNVMIDWYNNGTNPRTYKYTVQLSRDGENFTVVDDKSENNVAADTTNRHAKITSELDPATAYGRYVKIDITGGPGWSDCSEISEITVNGWRLTSSSEDYEVDEKNRLVIIRNPALQSNDFTWQMLNAALHMDGTHLSAQEHNTSAYFVIDGDQWKVVDSDGNEHLYYVRFAAAVPVTGISISQSTLSLAPEGTAALTAAVQPAGALHKGVTWSSSNESVATVDANGVVTAVAEGTAVITATTDEGAFTASCTVTVRAGGAPDTPGTPSTPSTPSTGESTSRPQRPSGSSSSSSKDKDDRPAADDNTEKKPAEEPSAPAAPETAPSQPAAATSRFPDVASTEWYAGAVQYVTEKGIMQGNGGSFAPQQNLTRSMLAQILYSLDGAPQSPASHSFPDVKPGDWFANAAAWAASRQIITGYSNGSFGAADPVTREQLASILYRYLVSKGGDISAAAGLGAFSDSGSVSDWAVQAMEWAVGAGLLNGKSGGRLDPKGHATRAEIAQILMVFDMKYPS